jgi:polysaccharide export outer membrane protein
VQLPGIGNVPVIGLTLDELQMEIEQRYAQVVLGIGVTPVLNQIAPRFVYVGGEVRNPNRYTLEAPTTAIMAIEMAGSWLYGANLREIVVFRRGDDWRLIATKLDLQQALIGKRPCPKDEIWLRDSDIIYVPKGKHLLRVNDIDLFFTRGLYRILPVNGSFSWSSRM